MTPQEQLCEKMRVEQSAYCLWLTAQPPEEILNHAYEYSVREDIILATEEMNLTPARVRALLKSPAPLADVYKDFSKLETDHIEKVVTGLFYSCANIQTTMSILVPAIDRRIYIIKRSSTVNIRIFIYDSLFHTSNSG